MWYETKENSNLCCKPKLLWTNSDPAVAFEANTTISLDLSKYDGVIIQFRRLSKYDTISCRVLMLKGETNYGVASTSDTDTRTRWISSVSDSGVTFGDCSNNNGSIPTKIYGINIELT